MHFGSPEEFDKLVIRFWNFGNSDDEEIKYITDIIQKENLLMSWD